MEHCIAHEDTRNRLIKAETKVEMQEMQISDLYDKHEVMINLLMKIREDITTGNAEVSNFLKRYEERVEYGDKIIRERAEAMAKIEEKIEELDKFSWFRNTMNKIRDNFLVLVAGGIIILLAGVVTAWQKIKAWLLGI